MPHDQLHDPLFRSAFSDPRRAAALIRAVLPPRLVRLVCWDRFEKVAVEFVDKHLRMRRPDLVWCLPLRGQRLPLVLILEHQSWSLKRMCLRILDYALRFWAWWAGQHRRAPRLPPVVGLVVSHDERGWRSPTRLRELVQVAPSLAAVLGPKLPEFEFFSEDLRRRPDQDILGWDMDAQGKLTLLLLKHARGSPDLRDQLRSWATLFAEVLAEGEDAFARFVCYIVRVSARVTAEQMASDFADVVSKRAGEVIMTEAERLIAKGEKRGLERGVKLGEKRGVERGVKQGLQRGIRRLFEKRLGRPLAKPEVQSLYVRLDTLGPDRLADVVLDLSPGDLATWLADPNAK